MREYFESLSRALNGEFYYDASALHQSQLRAYATDASVYQEQPLAVALAKNVDDIKRLVRFATEHRCTLIPRAAGTSLAGQVVGKGIVVDMSKYWDEVIEVNASEKWVRVQPGVIRDDLNHFLKPYGLMFGPETSTASRAMIGGMVGNNSCGLHSMVWGDTRQHLLEVKMLLADGSEVIFKEEDLLDTAALYGHKRTVYEGLSRLLTEENRALIRTSFPKDTVVRRNTGYALDSLIQMQPFEPNGSAFNVCKLIAGSEGTLGFITEIKLNLLDLPPKQIGLVCIHTHSLNEAFQANFIALGHRPMASELVDKYIMDFTINHPEYHKNRFFIEGDPAAVLMVEFMEETMEAVETKTEKLVDDLKAQNCGYAFPVLYNDKTLFAWDVRKAGLGLLRNIQGDTQPVNLIEDCAVAPAELASYIEDLQHVLEKNGVKASYYAHAGAGEVHVEPLINLRTAEGLKTFRQVLADTVQLIKKYKGSLSGEHGDGRLRGEFIPDVVGSRTYALFQEIKVLFDPAGIFNAGKITHTPAMDTHLRVQADQPAPDHKTYFDFSEDQGILRLSEKCSGSGDCRRSAISGGLMCPSYMATRREKDTTRARANLLRQFLSNPADLRPFDHDEIHEVMDLCLSCKGCKVECPSSVDVTKMKAEFLQQYYDQHGAPLRAKLIANFATQMKMASFFRPLFNGVFGNRRLRRFANRMVGFHPDRSIPLVAKTTWRHWFEQRRSTVRSDKAVVLFCDEFTNYLDVEIGKKAVLLLEALGYQVHMLPHLESGRSFLSKGFVKRAARIANQNIDYLGGKIAADLPLVGIEPSAILTVRDEYIDLATSDRRATAKALAQYTFTIEEFLAAEYQKQSFTADFFTKEKRQLVLHGHCYQKTLSSQRFLEEILSIPQNYRVETIPSGCCGMAGSFGYEAEHYDVSQQVGALILYPYLKNAAPDTLIVASGTSCRHQIRDGISKTAQHPVEILYAALISKL